MWPINLNSNYLFKKVARRFKLSTTNKNKICKLGEKNNGKYFQNKKVGRNVNKDWNEKYYVGTCPVN